MTQVKSPRFDKVLTAARDPKSELGQKIGRNEAVKLRNAAALDFVAENHDLRGTNAKLQHAGVKPFPNEESAWLTADQVAREQAAAAAPKTVKYLQGLHPVSPPLSFIDQKHLRIGTGDNDWPAVYVGIDVQKAMAAHGWKATDENLSDKLYQLRGEFDEQLSKSLPGSLRKPQIMSTLTPSPAAAKVASEQLRMYLSSNRIQKFVKEGSMKPSDAKALRAFNTEFLTARGSTVVVPLNGVKPETAKAALNQLFACEPDLQHYWGISFRFERMSA